MGLNFRLFQASVGCFLGALVTGSSRLWIACGAIFAVCLVRSSYLTRTLKARPPRSTPVPNGKTRICVAGYTHSGPTAKAHYLADLIAKEYPTKYETWYYFDHYAFFDFTKKKFDPVPFPPHLKGHATSPFVWFEKGSDNKIEPVGGSDHMSEWALKTFPDNSKIAALAKENWMLKPYVTLQFLHCDEGRPLPPATCAA